MGWQRLSASRNKYMAGDVSSGCDECTLECESVMSLRGERTCCVSLLLSAAMKSHCCEKRHLFPARPKRVVRPVETILVAELLQRVH